MNFEKLNQIAAQPALITQQDAQELEELTRSFPYFATPYILLSHYYLKQNDYRFEDTLQKTALRVENRTWLHNFLHAAPHQATVTEIAEPEMVMTETGVVETSAEIEAELSFDTEPAEAPIIEIESPATLIESAENIAEPTETLHLKPADEGESLMHLHSLIEIDLEPLPHLADTGQDEETVYEEIEALVPANSVDSIPTLEETQEAEHDELLLNLGSSSILVPFSENEPEEELSVNTPISSALPADIEEEEQVFEEISDDFSQPMVVTAPEIQEMEEIESEPEVEVQTEEEKPALPVVEQVKPLYANIAYNIEDYYPPVVEEKDPTDFFSWLSNPKFLEEEKEAEPEIEVTENKKENLIEKFLRTNPSISRPKNDFFSPGEFARKSEHLSEDLATETLANVYLHQNNPAKAIKIYETLVLKFPEKSAYFAALIEKTKKEYNL